MDDDAAATGDHRRDPIDEARAWARQGRLDAWVDAYLRGAGRNLGLATGLRKQRRWWIGPVELPLDRLSRSCGPEDGMEYPVPFEAWDRYVEAMAASLRDGWIPPPLIAEERRGVLSLRDGNHRHAALTRAGRTMYWALIWFNDAESVGRYQGVRLR